MRLKSIHRTRMTMGMLIGLLAAIQGSVALGAIRWGEAVLRQQADEHSHGHPSAMNGCQWSG